MRRQNSLCKVLQDADRFSNCYLLAAVGFLWLRTSSERRRNPGRRSRLDGYPSRCRWTEYLGGSQFWQRLLPNPEPCAACGWRNVVHPLHRPPKLRSDPRRLSVRPIRAATALSVTACGPASISRSRAAASAIFRLSSGERRRFAIDIYVSKPIFKTIMMEL